MRSIFLAALVAFTGLSAAAPAYHQYQPPQHWRDVTKRSPAPEPIASFLDIIPKRNPSLPLITAVAVPKRQYVPSEKRAPRYHHAPKYHKVKRQEIPAVVPATDGVVPTGTVPDTTGLVPEAPAVGGI